jgi:UDP:flavonoid glycosyltransferase YjiC (YdhE family)
MFNGELDYLGFRIRNLFNNPINIYPFPRAFDFPNNYTKKDRYLGFSVLKKREDFNYNGNHLKFNEELHKKLTTFKGIKIYITFGTIPDIHFKEYMRIIKVLVESLLNIGGVLIIISDAQKLEIQNKSVIEFHGLPQLKILEYVDLMINHGGLNSVIEGIYFKIPQIIIPINESWDQMGNGSRVEYHKIGMMLLKSQTFQNDLTQKLKLFLTNINEYQNSVNNLYLKCLLP